MAARSDIMAGRAFVELYTKREGLTKGLQAARQQLQDFGSACNAIGRTMMTMGLAAGGGIAIAGRQFIAFDDQMRAMKAAVGGTDLEFKRLTQVAKELGLQSGISAIQVGSLMLELGRAGFNPTQIEQMTASVLNLSKATGTQAARSAEIMTAAIRQFNLPATDATRVADGLTAAANMSATSVEALGEALSYAGPAADSLGMKIEDALAIMGTLGNIGIQGSEAGTVLRRLLTLTAADAEKMSQIFGVSFRDASGNARPLLDMLEDVHNKTKDLGTSVRAAKFNEAFGILGIVGALSLGKASGSVRQLAADIRAAGGVAAATAKEMESGPGGALRRLTAAVEGAAIAFGEGLAPAFDLVAGYANSFANVVSKIFQQNQDLAVGIAKATAGMLAGGVAFLTIGAAANAAAFGLGALRVALVPASYAAGTLIAVLRNSSIVTANLIRGVQGISSSLGSGFISTVTAAHTGLVSMGTAAGNAIQGGLMAVLRNAPAAFSAFAAAARSAFAGASSAASKFSTELRYWLGRPFEYFKAITPLFAADLQLGIANAMARIRAASAQAADGVRAAWTSVSARISGVAGQAAAMISARFAALVNPVAAVMAQISTRATATWNSIANAAGSMVTNVKQRLGATLPLIAQDFNRIAGYARTAAGGVMTAFTGAFARIQSMASSTAGMMSRGIGAGFRGVGGAMAGGAGLLSMLGAGAGGMLGRVAMLAPSMLMLASSMTMLINPATLMTAAIVGGVYAWTQYSAEGQAALAAVSEAFAPILATAQQTFAGVSQAIQSGNLALAGKIAMAGLKLSAIDGMIALKDALISNWGSTTDEMGKNMEGTMVTPWENAVQKMAAVWDQFSEGLVKTITGAMSAVVEVWEKTVNRISDFYLEAAASGGLVGQFWSNDLGVNMGDAEDESMRLDRANKKLDRLNTEKAIAGHKLDLADAEFRGDKEGIDKYTKAIAEGERKIAELRSGKSGPSFLETAKESAKAFTGQTVADLKKYLAEMDAIAEARARNSEPQLPDFQAKRDKARAELDALNGEANFAKAWADLQQEIAENTQQLPEGVAGGGAAGGAVREMLDAKTMSATFSAAAAEAMGRGATNNPQERAAAAAELTVKELQAVLRAFHGSTNLLPDMENLLDRIENNTRNPVARAG